MSKISYTMVHKVTTTRSLHKFGCVLTYRNNNIKLFKTEIFSETILSLFLDLSSSSFQFWLK